MNKEKYIDNILLENDRLYKENQQLHNKIDKAIEYIEENAIDENGDIGINFYANNTYELLEILNGGDVDE